jgi:DnaJ-class molecular chaperone
MKTLKPATKKSLLPCQECNGYGREVADVIFGSPRYEICGWCNGSGEVTPEVKGVWLSYRRDLKRVRKV